VKCGCRVSRCRLCRRKGASIITKNLSFYIGLLGASIIFLALERATHIEFLLHLAAIPLEVLLAVFIVERFLTQREKKERRRHLMFIKSYLFRSEMRNLFIANFDALKFPPVTMSKMKASSLEDLKQMRSDAERLEYRSPQAMEPVIMEYAKTESVWHKFREWAITYDFEDIFQDMIYILHFIYDVKLFKENNPDKLFIYEAEKRPLLMQKVRKVLGDGIQKFLDYAIELKEKQPGMFEELIADYELSAQIRGMQSKGQETAT